MKYVNSSNINYYDSSFVNETNVMLSEDKTTITIINTERFYDYTIYNLATGEQAYTWENGVKGTVTFSQLNPKIKYAVRTKSTQALQPMPLIKPEFVIIPTIPLVDADIIIPVKAPTYNTINGCGMIAIKADSNHGYAILNDKNLPLTEKQLKIWGIKVTDDKGFLLPKTDDGYFFGCKTNMHFEVPAGGEFKLGGKNLEKKYTFINGPTFNTPGVYYNAWYVYVLPYNIGEKGSYNFNIIPACKYSEYKLYNNSGKLIDSKTVKSDITKISFTNVNPLDSYVTGNPVPLK